MCSVCVYTSVKYTNYISRPFSASVSPSNPSPPSCQKIGPHKPHPQRSPGVTRFLSLALSLSSLFFLFVSCLFCLCPSPLFLLFSNKNNRLWNAFSCGITHRHQPPHAIRLSQRERWRRRWWCIACLPSSGEETELNSHREWGILVFMSWVLDDKSPSNLSKAGKNTYLWSCCFSSWTGMIGYGSDLCCCRVRFHSETWQKLITNYFEIFFNRSNKPVSTISSTCFSQSWNTSRYLVLAVSSTNLHLMKLNAIKHR